MQQQSPSLWVDRLARFGYAAKGIVYSVVGLLAVQTTIGPGGETTDTNGALQAVARQPSGQFLLLIIGIGLLGYVLWRFVQTVLDPEQHGSDGKGIAQRLGYAISGIIYASLAWSALKLAFGTSNGGNSNSTEDWTARLLSQPFGQWLVGTLGAFIIGLGLYQLYKAYTAKFRNKLKLREMSSDEETWATRAGRCGLAARGIVFGLIGIFLIQAARQYNPNKAIGLDGALQTLVRQPYGPFLLGIVALGLVAYGIYMIIQARYRRFMPGQ